MSWRLISHSEPHSSPRTPTSSKGARGVSATDTDVLLAAVAIGPLDSLPAEPGIEKAALEAQPFQLSSEALMQGGDRDYRRRCCYRGLSLDRDHGRDVCGDFCWLRHRLPNRVWRVRRQLPVRRQRD